MAGGARAMLIQLYRAGAGLVHEDLAPRDSAPTITFRRVGLEPMEYELRVVNMEPNATHPFTLTLTTWQVSATDRWADELRKTLNRYETAIGIPSIEPKRRIIRLLGY